MPQPNANPARRLATLDALEARLTGPKRVALFGHRAVGKTTLLAMFYREASAGRVPGVRLAAGDPITAEYLADKIAQIEAGEPPAGTLAETPLRLRLYHGLARLDLIVKDYQGEHVALGSDAPIREFFADCDAVLLCLDPAVDDAAARRRRQQEVEDLIERYIEVADDGTAGRPVALLVTKYDRVIERGGPPPEEVERLVESRYGMTRHALAQHAPRSAVFAVSAYGPQADAAGRPPAELEPMGLEGPLAWLAGQLEDLDREALDWLWDLAPTDAPRLTRCVQAFERRYPRSTYTDTFRRRLTAIRRRRTVRRALLATTGLAALGVSLAGYDAWGYRSALAFERSNPPAPAVEARWTRLLTWHPTLPLFFPRDAEQGRKHLRTWRVKAAEARLAAGAGGAEVVASMRDLKEQAPELAPDIERVEQAGNLAEQERRWRALDVADLVAIDDPQGHLSQVRQFLRDYPEGRHTPEAVSLAKGLESLVAADRDRTDRHAVDALVRASGLPDVPVRDLIERAEQFLTEHPDSRYKGEVDELLTGFVRRLDEADIDRARSFSREHPTNFVVRREKYQDYLKAHAEGGRFLAEATAALDQIDRDRDVYLYRQAYDHAVAHPDDVPAIAARMRTYLEANPAGRFAAAAKGYIAWWERISVPGTYKVVLRRGRVEPGVDKYFNGGGPDLSVKVTVAGVDYGPSPVVRDSHTPIWDWSFPTPVRWKYGDPIKVRILDNDWSVSGVYTIQSTASDKLALRMLSGPLRPATGGSTQLVFASDFQEPSLPKPE